MINWLTKNISITDSLSDGCGWLRSYEKSLPILISRSSSQWCCYKGSNYKRPDAKILEIIHVDVVYCKYYEEIYILFHTGMRISEFCGLTMMDIDLEKRTININHQLQKIWWDIRIWMISLWNRICLRWLNNIIGKRFWGHSGYTAWVFFWLVEI